MMATIDISGLYMCRAFMYLSVCVSFPPKHYDDHDVKDGADVKLP